MKCQCSFASLFLILLLFSEESIQTKRFLTGNGSNRFLWKRSAVDTRDENVCTDVPTAPRNSFGRCRFESGSAHCWYRCTKNKIYPDYSTVKILTCENGVWTPSSLPGCLRLS